MVRKIPARKHFGIRDPIKQQEERLALIKDKINNPPEKRDFQKVSHSLGRFIKLKEAAKNESSQKISKKQRKRQITGNEDKPENYTKKGKKKTVVARNDKEFENLHQRPNESDRNFMRRVNRVTQESVEEAKFEAKYGVEVILNKKTGEIKLKKRPTNEIDEQLKQNAQNLKHKAKKTQTITIAPEERKKMVKALMEEKNKRKRNRKHRPLKNIKETNQIW